jgi:hypothetical protein
MTLFDTTNVALFPELDSIIYLSGMSNDFTRDTDDERIGYLVTPESDKQSTQTKHYRWYGADNGCFNSSKPGRTFDADKWLAWLSRVDLRGCLFAALPDVLEWVEDPETGKLFPIGNCDATLERSALYVDAVKAMGFPAALVAQDGLSSLSQVGYDVDAIFIGGSDAYKLGEDAARVTAEAKARGMWVHMGRVNSKRRLAYAASIGCDSADGTFLTYGGKRHAAEQFARMMRWFA